MTDPKPQPSKDDIQIELFRGGLLALIALGTLIYEYATPDSQLLLGPRGGDAILPAIYCLWPLLAYGLYATGRALYNLRQQPPPAGENHG